MQFSISTTKKQELIDITQEVQETVKENGIEKGLCHVFTPHATAAIIINENWDPNICIDFLNALNKVIPDHAGYLHDKVDNNGGAHIKAAVLGPSEIVPIKAGKLQLGKWQSIMLVELDGPRNDRKIEITVAEGA